ncbi:MULTISPECIES: hypothetical protein [unclassified Microbacterium]|uniref:hypothetical protein n=1 Tax=unclassified Microbacterium TaxID=2609290 RepID=UPI000EA8DDFD|nr:MULTISPECIES: hypothetical protein [unclassified Microbacterium]MBT2484828.1 hypothetical protein [Microbacterium sp. ISL-108]RKN67698.1 hypothetical protein D7252_08925 [Microbacterium sp. CGR2]
MSATTLAPPLDGLRYEVVHAIDETEDYTEGESRRLTDDIAEANVITSRVSGEENLHKVILDIDFPAKLVPSSTDGHFHLYIDKAIHWEAYVDLLGAMADAGLVEEGYVSASLERGHTAARLPWVKKSDGPRPICVGCRKRPHEFSTYRYMVAEDGYADADEAVRRNEGTYNRENGHFWCDGCYIRAGQPLGVAQ